MTTRRGGRGDIASKNEEAKEQDGKTKDAANMLVKYYKDEKRIDYKKKLPQDQIPGGIGACQPDGGAWYVDGVLCAAFESKKQGPNEGNASERWHKNYNIFRKISPNGSYVTFATGQGVRKITLRSGKTQPGPIVKAINIKHYDQYGGYDNYYPGKNSCFLKEKGFTVEEMYGIMVEVLDERLAAASMANYQI